MDIWSWHKTIKSTNGVCSLCKVKFEDISSQEEGLMQIHLQNYRK